MKRRRRWVVLAVGAGLAALAAAVLLWPADRSRIQGTWVGDGTRLTIRGDPAVLRWMASPESRTDFRLDRWASAPRIVVFDADAQSVKPPTRILGVRVGGPSPGLPGEECRGIYELRGDRLRICLPPPGADFPTSFDPAAGGVRLAILSGTWHAATAGCRPGRGGSSVKVERSAPRRSGRLRSITSPSGRRSTSTGSRRRYSGQTSTNSAATAPRRCARTDGVRAVSAGRAGQHRCSHGVSRLNEVATGRDMPECPRAWCHPLSDLAISMEENNLVWLAGGSFEECRLMLRFFGDDLEPESISSQLGSTPTDSCRMGDLHRTGRANEVTGRWVLKTERAAVPVTESLMQLFSRLTNDLTVWKFLTQRYQSDLRCHLIAKRWNRGMTLPPQLLAAIEDRGLELDITRILSRRMRVQPIKMFAA